MNIKKIFVSLSLLIFMLICDATVCAAEYQTDGNTITVTGAPSE